MSTRLLRALWPDRLLPRLLWLWGAGMAGLLLIGLLALRQLSLQEGSAQIADLLAAHVVALRALPAASAAVPRADGGEPLLEVEFAGQPPAAAGRPWLPFDKALVERLQQRLADGSEVRWQSAPTTRLWVAPARSGQPWLAVAIPDFRSQATRLTLVVLTAAILLLALAGLVLAQQVLWPLRRLAALAPALAQGESIAPRQLATAPRELRALAQALAQAGHAAQLARGDRELMLVGLSHDLRTPLARLRLALELLPDTDPELTAQMQADIEVLDGLTGAFVDLIRQARNEPEVGFDLAALLRQALGTQHADWQCHGPEVLLLRGRRLALQRVIDNLLSNARRHGAPPFALHFGWQSGRAFVRIEDCGPGIAETALARVTEPYRRGESSAGHGLGLAVCRQLVTGMGGTLTLRNRPGGGLSAAIEWPAAAD